MAGHRARGNLRIACLPLLVLVIATLPGAAASLAAAAAAERTAPPTPQFPEPMPAPESGSVKLDPPPPASATRPQEAAGSRDTYTTFSHSHRGDDGTVTTELFSAPTFRTNAAPGTRVDGNVRSSGSSTQPVAADDTLRPIKFGSQPSNIVELGLDGGAVVLSALSLQVSAPTRTEDGALYPAVATDTDLRYRVRASGLKEELVLRSAAAPTSFAFHLSDPNNRLGNASPLAGGGYRFAGRIQGDVAIDLPAPVAYEQSANPATAPVLDPASAHLSLRKAGDGYDLTVAVDPDWARGKSYPLVLDPTVAFNEANGAGSTSFKSGWAFKPTSGVGTNVINTTSDHLNVGTFTYGGTDYNPARSYLQFDVSSIPAGSAISSAALGIYLPDCVGAPIPTPPGSGPPSYLCNNATTYTVDAHHISGAWSAASTWTQLAAATAAGILDTDVIAPFAPPDETMPPRRAFNNLASEVSGWVNSPATNNGVSLQLRTETANKGGPSYYSSRGGYIVHPALTVTYTPPAGAPQAVTASPRDTTSATVTWAAPVDAGGPLPASYSVTAWQGGTQGSQTATCTAPCTSVVVGGLVPTQSYRFRVVPSTSASAWADSNTITAAGPIAVELAAANVAPTTSIPGVAANTVGRGDEVAYTLTIRNLGVLATSPGTVTASLPAGISGLLGPCVAAPAGPTCSVANNTLTVDNLASVAAFGAVTITYRVTARGVDRGCAAAISTANGAAGGAQATLPLAICGSGLGLERWRSTVAETLGPASDARIDVANGNLVVQATDSTPVQARGDLAYVLRRTYNSQDPTIVSLPGSIGGGWQLNVGQTDGLVGDGVGATALAVPSVASLTTPAAVTLVDRDGTRHLFESKGIATSKLGHVAAGVLVADVAGALPRALAFNASSHSLLCADQTYAAPAGVHVALWRYLAVNGATCADLSNQSNPPVVLGYVGLRPDRLRYEFDATGRLMDMTDANGVSLRYRYDGSGRLADVYEPLSSCPNGPTWLPLRSTCRALSFNYSDLNLGLGITDGRDLCSNDGAGAATICVVDPAGRTTKYVRDAAALSSHLVKVINPDATAVLYTYGNCGGWANSLCSVTDLRTAEGGRHGTEFTYAAQAVGVPRVATVKDRRATTTSLTYATPDYVTADTAGAARYAADTPSQRRRFVGIDGRGRVREIDEGDIADNYRHQFTSVWDDGATVTCRQPDAATVDNNLCSVTRRSLSPFAPDEVTNYLYGAEGQLLASDQATAPANVKTTFGYHAQYVGTTATLGYDDTVAGGGAVTSTGTGGRGDATTLFVLSDRTQSLTPRGNAAGATVATHATTYKPDNATGASPNAPATAPTCANPATPATNTGAVCEVVAPSSDGTNPTVTRYTYNPNGERATMTSPKAIAEGGLPTTYTYFADGDFDLSGSTSAGGWLKGITDPALRFVAFAYDRAGNVARTWDRSSTARALAADPTKILAAYPGSATSPFNTEYRQTLYGPYAGAPGGTAGYAAPWRSLLSERDALANTTTYTVDANGNRTVIRPPRGTAAGTNAYDVTQAFDANDNLASALLPLQNQAITSQSDSVSHPTTHAYDPFDNRTSSTDPAGQITAFRYDSVNRHAASSWTTTTASPACVTAGAAQAPLPAGRKACTATTAYDGAENLIGTQDGNGQVSYFGFDGAHRETQRSVPRADGVYTGLVTTTNYDHDGHVLDVCPPREFDATIREADATGVCNATAPLSVHNTYDAAGRVASTKTYRLAGAANTTTFGYDADGNQRSVTDANVHTTTALFDLLDRKISQAVPRDATTSNTTNWAYDPSGNLTAVTRPGAPTTRVTAYGYDAANRPTDTVVGSDNLVAAAAGTVDAAGTKNIRTRVAYDPDGHVVARYEPRAFDPAESAGLATFVARTDFDANGRPSAQFVPRYDGGAHSDLGISLLQASGNPQTAQCPPNPSPAPQAVAGVAVYGSAVGVCVTRIASFDRAGNPTSITMPTATGSGSSNRHVDYAYTDDNRVASVNTPSPVTNGARVTAATYAYDGVGRAVSVTNANGHANATSYTADGLVASEAGQAAGSLTHVTSTTYDANGNPIRVTDPVGNTTITQFWDDNLRKAHMVPDPPAAGEPWDDWTVYYYDGVGNPTAVHSPSAVAADANNPGGIATTNTYTFDNLLAHVYVPVTTAAGPSRILTQRHTAYAYDPGGRKLSQTARLIDAAGGLVAGIGAQNTVQSFSWHPNDRMGTQTGRDATTITTDYDAAGNSLCVYVTASCATDTAAVVGSYFADGLVRLVGDGTNTERNAYDGAGDRVARKDTSDPASYLTTYARGDAGLATSMASQAAGWTGGSPTATTWTYDAGGRRVAEVAPHGLRSAWTYAADDTLTSVVRTNNANPPTPANTIASWSYAYDKNYRQLQQAFTGMKNTGAVMASTSLWYHYDPAGRVDIVGRDGQANLWAAWDHNGNRTAYTDPSGATVTQAFRADDSIAARTEGAGHTYKQYAWGGDELSDVAGDDKRTVYDGFDRTRCVGPTTMPDACTGSDVTTFAYDGLDRQRSRTEGATTTALHYDGLDSVISVEEKTTAPAAPTDTPIALDPDAMPVGSTDYSVGTAARYLSDDGQGNVTTVTGALSIDCTARFDPFGTPIKADLTGLAASANPCNSGATSNDFFYRAGRRDTATRSYQLGSRTYDPKKAGFSTPDSYRAADPGMDLSVGTDPLTANRYGYVNGDPVNLADPDGHDPPCRERYAGGCNYLYTGDAGPNGEWKAAFDKGRAEWDFEHKVLLPLLLGKMPVEKDYKGKKFSKEQTEQIYDAGGICLGGISLTNTCEFRPWDLEIISQGYGGTRLRGKPGQVAALCFELCPLLGALATFATKASTRAVLGRLEAEAAELAPNTAGKRIFRAVQADELADLAGSGAFRTAPGLEGKYFWPTRAQADDFAALATKAKMGGPYCVVSGCIPAHVLRRIEAVPMDALGPAYFIPEKYLSLIDDVLIQGGR